MNDERKAIHVFVSGRVQGVSYRASTQRAAASLGLTGWVCNCADGRVELWAEGAQADLQALVTWCHEGPRFAVVTGVESSNEEPVGFEQFEIRRTRMS